jgi:hypothetical protein
MEEPHKPLKGYGDKGVKADHPNGTRYASVKNPERISDCLPQV